jgi:zinc protease
MRTVHALLAASLFLVSAASSRPARAAGEGAPKVQITHRIEQLSNGMTVIYHEDHSVPLSVVNISYKVGSRNEEAGRTGFAHLFEHLMFMGTRRAPTKMFDSWMESSGGWNNAWTSEDRTDYFDVAPPSTLPLLLWLEADRMRDIGPLMTQEKLNAQRDVVKNERRQSYENRPYGAADLKLSELLYPQSHPYFHSVIGSHTDLEAASVADVKQFFATWYDPSNASLVIAGDFNFEETRKLVFQYFATLPSKGKPSDVSRVNAANVIPANVTETLSDDVEASRLTLAWTSPAHFAVGDAELDLASTILGDGKASRLYRRLVVDDKLAQSVLAHQSSNVLGSHFEVEVMLKPGASFEKVEASVLSTLQSVAEKGPTEIEVKRAVAGYSASFVKRLEGVKERASILNMYLAETGRADYAEQDLARYTSASATNIGATLKAMLARPKVSLRVVPAAKGGAK